MIDEVARRRIAQIMRWLTDLDQRVVDIEEINEKINHK